MNILKSNLYKAVSLLLGIFLFFILINSQPALSQTIDANPNPVLLNCDNGQTEGSTTITWDDQGETGNIRVFLEINSANLSVWDTADAGTEVYSPIVKDNTYRFILAKGSTNNLEFLDTVTVTTDCAGERPEIGVFQPGSDVLKPVLFYDNIKADSHGTYVDVSFTTTSSSLPVVMVSESEPNNFPLVSNDDVAAFNQNDIVASNFAQIGTQHFARLGNLKPGTSYHYVISTHNKSIDKWMKVKGKFRTQNRSVKVTFEKIKVLDDSDDLSDGDFNFSFYINNNLIKGVNKHIGTDQTFNVNITKTASSKANSLNIDVVGFDDDETEWPGSLQTCGKASPTSPINPSEGENDCGEWTTAAKNLSLVSNAAYLPNVDYPEEFTKSFTINAFPKGDDSDVKFRVHGKYEVSYFRLKIRRIRDYQ